MDKLPTIAEVAEQPSPRIQMFQLQRENASLQTEKVDPRSARNLLRKVFKKNWEPLPTAQKLRIQ
jgi:hypothetical protein